jgi:hypothetical protein
MTSHGHAGRRAAIWAWVKAFSYSLPWWIAAVSAYFSQEAAFRVFQAESKRLSFETARYTHDTYRDYVIFRQQKTNRLPSACLANMVKRNGGKTGDYLIPNEELRWIFVRTPGYAFQYDETRHAALAACLDDDDLKRLLIVKDALGRDDEERANNVGKIMDAITEKFGRNVTLLDAELVGYAHAKADKVIICENFSGFLQSDRHLEELGYGVFGKFLLRMMESEVRLIRLENFPNLFRFTTSLAAISGNFTAHIDCAKLPDPPPRDPGRLDWAREMLGRWLW